MRRALLIAMLCLSAIDIPADAAPAVEASRVYAFGPFTSVDEAQLELTCQVEDLDFFFFLGDYEEFDEGWSRGSRMGGYGFNGLRVQVADEGIELVEHTPLPVEGTLFQTYEISPGSTFRFVIALWGGTSSCDLARDGSPEPLAEVQPSSGTHLTDQGFTSEAAGAGALGLNAIAGATYSREVSGFLWFFWTTEAGAVTATGPDGEFLVGAGSGFDTWLAGSQETEGTWVFDAPVAVYTHLVVVTTPG